MSGTEKKMLPRYRIPLQTVSTKLANTDVKDGTNASIFGLWLRIDLPQILSPNDGTGVAEKNPFILIPTDDVKAQFPEIIQNIGKETGAIFVDGTDLVFEGKDIDFK